MKKTLVALACLIAGMAMICSAGAFAEDFCVPLGTITLNAPDGVTAKRTAVDFPHSQHFSLKCQDCHHKWTGEEAVAGCMTGGCHDATASLATEKPAEAWKYYKKAFHASCIGCHKERAKKNRALEKNKTLKTELVKTGPTGCTKCHPKG